MGKSETGENASWPHGDGRPWLQMVTPPKRIPEDDHETLCGTNLKPASWVSGDANHYLKNTALLKRDYTGIFYCCISQEALRKIKTDQM